MGGAFRYCTSLASVIIGNGITSINGSIPMGTDATYGAFQGCTNLTSVIIGNRVTNIGESAFMYCERLANITIPRSVTSIGVRAFSDCTSLISVTFATGSNISSTNFGNFAFPSGNGSDQNPVDTLKIAYATGKAGTYTRRPNGITWTKQ